MYLQVINLCELQLCPCRFTTISFNSSLTTHLHKLQQHSNNAICWDVHPEKVKRLTGAGFHSITKGHSEYI